MGNSQYCCNYSPKDPHDKNYAPANPIQRNQEIAPVGPKESVVEDSKYKDVMQIARKN